MLQYRTAALAGFGTQCWWGGIKVMVLAAFYGGASMAGTPMSLTQAITYSWLSQGLLVLVPWLGDPEVAQAVRTGAVAYDRLRPVDAYALWFARSAGWIAARVLPRVALMAAFAAVALPLVGLGDWAWKPPASFAAAIAFLASSVLALLLSTSMVMLLNIAATAALNERGINALAGPVVIVFSGNLLPLMLLPNAWQTALLLQPFAGVVDIPARIYFGLMSGWQAMAGLGLQSFWIVVLVVFGRMAMQRTMRRLEVQGG
ncbi:MULTISPECIES: ABC transporter permease [Variovorax]|uniref:ABC transporter permease n=1 Tax=Variovorax TaxID=34072 RepID=UPI00086AEC60|nr:MULTISPECIES: ABC transporter permease [Variovorax]ODU16447.1 MAG: ABC transporter permease [Variovorax sp. SCN 67-85]ODV26064.1 MAG: ABC transporter permease [Variovorax sp. SCN 67-20]OJZ10420.1 MAG: ABC transporter permease [Variovorax sp. 67-131]UKI11969.1 ABC transporter permease [Variovorax paradoxus]